MKKSFFTVLIIILFTLTSFAARFTTVTTTDASQKAAVYQKIGLTDIKIVYHSPAVKKRVIWGKLVPFGKVWRAGANENTVIYFSTDVRIENKLLKKGKYGLHTIPGEKEWTIIFSRNHTSWGSYFYKEKEDALRVKVKPFKSAFNEWLTYEFTEKNNDSALISLKWEKLSIPFKVNINTKEIVLNKFRLELRSLPFWYWRGTYGAAKYCLDNNINLVEALTWIDQSISVQENFTNIMLKSDILSKLGKDKEAAAMKSYAKKIALDRELTQYAYSFVMKDKLKSEKILIENSKRFKNWFTYKALARFYNYFKDSKKALKYFRLSLKKAPAHQKERIKKAIKALEK